MKIVPENLNELENFRKEENPLKSLDLGYASKINKITSEDLELLSIYTNGYGKGHKNPDVFYEIYEDMPGEAKIQIKRAEEVYNLLLPYEYYFGDSFGPGQKSERNEYIHDYLRGPKYNYAYDYFPMEDDEWHVFFSEIELPSAIKLS